MQNVLSLKLIITLSLFPQIEQVFFLIRSFKYSQINIFSSLFKGGRTGEPTPFVRLPSYLFTAFLVVFFYYQFLLLTFDLFIFFMTLTNIGTAPPFFYNFYKETDRSQQANHTTNTDFYFFLISLWNFSPFTHSLFILAYGDNFLPPSFQKLEPSHNRHSKFPVGQPAWISLLRRAPHFNGTPPFLPPQAERPEGRPALGRGINSLVSSLCLTLLQR